MKQKPVSAREIKKFLWANSYGKWNNGNLGDFAEEFDEYPDFLVQVLLDHFQIFRKEIKLREKKK